LENLGYLVELVKTIFVLIELSFLIMYYLTSALTHRWMSQYTSVNVQFCPTKIFSVYNSSTNSSILFAIIGIIPQKQYYHTYFLERDWIQLCKTAGGPGLMGLRISKPANNKGA
jgi:hypothetical protein